VRLRGHACCCPDDALLCLAVALLVSCCDAAVEMTHPFIMPCRWTGSVHAVALAVGVMTWLVGRQAPSAWPWWHPRPTGTGDGARALSLHTLTDFGPKCSRVSLEPANDLRTSVCNPR
jgi:hypothetical protein